MVTQAGPLPSVFEVIWLHLRNLAKIQELKAHERLNMKPNGELEEKNKPTDQAFGFDYIMVSSRHIFLVAFDSPSITSTVTPERQLLGCC